MKKIYALIITTVFLMSSFLAINLYISSSFPGYGGNITCNNCHNQPAFVKNVDVSFAMNNFTGAAALISSHAIYATDEVPIIQTNNRSVANLEFVKMQFMKNSTDVIVMATIDDNTPTPLNTPSATSDKFGIIFNIDVKNFTVGDFLTNYNSTFDHGTNGDLNQVLSGQMGFPEGAGHADLWYVDMGKTGLNTTGFAQDEYITTAILSDGASHQDVSYSIWYGVTANHGSPVYGYRIIFVRPLDTSDPNDASFAQNGVGINYAIASWNNSATYYHHSSFDQMVIVGDQIGVVTQGTITVNNNMTQTITESASVTSSLSAFTVVFVLAALAIAIPVVTYFRPRK